MIGISGIDASAEKDSCGCFVASGFTDGRASILWGTLLIVASGATTRNWSAKRTYRSDKGAEMLIHEVKCDGCKTKAKLEWNGDNWITPPEWVDLWDDHAAKKTGDHLCPKCRPKTKRKPEDEDADE